MSGRSIGYAFYRKHCEECGALLSGSTMARWHEVIRNHNRDRHGYDGMYLDQRPVSDGGSET